MRGLLKVLNAIVTALLLLVILGSAALAISARRSGDRIPTILGRKVLTVLSGSMEPTIHTGDVIIVRPLQPGEAIQQADIITFRTLEKADLLITHRVAGILRVDGVPKAFITKGDANDAQDTTPVAPEQIVGRYQWRIPYFGYLANFLHKPLGIVLGVLLPGLALIGHELYGIWRLTAEGETARKQGGDSPGA